MRQFFIILVTLAVPQLLYSQTKLSQSSSKDSVLKVQQARKDSVQLAMQAKRDSIQAALDKKKEEARIRKQMALARRKKIIIPITEEIAMGYRQGSDGWTFFVNRGFIKNPNDENKHTRFLFFELGEKKNPKEIKTLNENFTNIYPNEPKPVSYKYGKINNFYPLRFGYGNSKPLTGKLDNKSVIIHWIYGTSLNIGFLKPYYLDLLIPEGSMYVRKVDKYSEANKTSFLDLENRGTIVGGTDFTHGISECKIIPGISVKSALYFDYSATKKTFLGIELGSSFEVYTKEVPIMAIVKNRPYFLNVYADFRFGKRWAKKPLDEEVIEF